MAIVSSLTSEMFLIHKAYKNGLDYYIGPEPKEEEQEEEEEEEEEEQEEEDNIEQEQEQEQEQKEEQKEDNIEQEQDKIPKNWLEIKYGRYIFCANVAPFFFVYVYSVYVRLEVLIELIKRL